MDKLRALQYFVCAAGQRSFAGAARRFEVSVPAVSKLVGALEREIGVRLFERTGQGLALTVDGRDYLEACAPAMEQLAAADELVRGSSMRPRGTLVIGATPHVARHCLVPALPDFRARYPDIELDIRGLDRVDDAEPGVVDVYVLQGWPEHPDHVHRVVSGNRLLTCASPDYWARHGVPAHPRDLARHTGLLLRNPQGTVLDLWEFEKAGETVPVTMRGWLTSDHRDVLLDAAVAGEGVARLGHQTCHDDLRSGRLVPVLLEWDMKGAPPISLLYRPNQRSKPRVRVFIEFATEVFRRLDAASERGTALGATERPPWHVRRYRRASSHLQQG